MQSVEIQSILRLVVLLFFCDRNEIYFWLLHSYFELNVDLSLAFQLALAFFLESKAILELKEP